MSELNKWQRVLRNEANKEQYRIYLDKMNSTVAPFLETRLPDEVEGDGPLGGIPFAVKDNIAVRDFKLTCGSKILEPLVSPYNATVVEKLVGAGAQVVGKTNLDEFGMGSSTDNSALQQTNNPWNLDAVAGGSSGGSAAAVAAGMVPFALGSDTGGSVRQPASFCGCYGLKPTYGVVSRYGLVAYASSLEVVGVLSRDVETMEQVFELMVGQDERDQSSVSRPQIPLDRGCGRIGVFTGLAELSPAVKATYEETIEFIKGLGIEVVEVDISALKMVVPAYYTIATAEASANLARYTGVRYGFRSADDQTMEQMVAASRNKGFGEEVKLRILLGTYVLRSGFRDQYYIRAQKIRTAIRNGFDNVFGEVDLILSPVFPTQAFLRGEGGLSSFQQKLADQFTASANLAGIPAASFPCGVKEGLPVGMQLLGPAFGEGRIFEMMKRLSPLSGEMTPPGFESGFLGGDQ